MNRLTILIPTYNRADFLYRNVKELFEMIRKRNLEDCVCIRISDNASTDHTRELMEKLADEAENIQLICRSNERNEGLGGNLLGLLRDTTTEFAMLLGDDDFIEEEYLAEVVSRIQSDTRIACILPSYQNITIDGEKMKRSRDVGKKSKTLKKGFYNCFVNSWRAHQLSGLVFKVDNLYEESVKAGLDNLYLLVYWIAEACLRGDTLHLTTYPVRVTRPSPTAKAWSYGTDGLIGDFFQNYKLMSEINYLQRGLLELKLLYVQYWRYAMYLKVGIAAFLKCILNVIKSPNSTYITKILFIIYIPIVGICQSMKLLFTGKILETLFMKVEI